MPAGRPSKYDPALAEEILERMANGESLSSICKAENMPAKSTVRKWVVGDVGGISEQYARARQAQMQAYEDSILELADDKDEDPARSRLQVDARKWIMSKIAPKQYGDKLQHTDADGDGPVKIVFGETVKRL